MKTRVQTRQAVRRRRGAALIMVMMLLLLSGLLVASLVALSQLDDCLTALDRDRATAAYLAESAVARTLWLLRYDCATYPTRDLGVDDPLADPEKERFLADGRPHRLELPGGVAEVAIRDLVSGLDISGVAPDQALKRSPEDAEFADDDERYQRYTDFLAAVKDYVDPDDMTQLVGGCEADDYAKDGRRPLPRNGPFQYREELLWVRGATEFFKVGEDGRMEGVMVLPPTSRMPVPKGNPSFFSASRDQLLKHGGFSAEDADKILDARKRWLAGEGRLEDLLDPAQLATLRQRFSFRESGYYTLMIKADTGPDTAPRILNCSLQFSGQLAATETIRYYEWLFLQ